VAKFTKDKQPSDGKRKDGRQQRIVPAFPRVGGGFIGFGKFAISDNFLHSPNIRLKNPRLDS